MNHQERAGFFVWLAVYIPLSAMGFQIVENPAAPRAKNAGRIVVPAEVLSISDEGTGSFYFKAPHKPRIGPDGSLFVLDENQILRFDADGKFRRNYFKKGQGPGEMQRVMDCLPTDRGLIIQADSPDKLMWFNQEGTFDREKLISTTTRAFAWILFGYGDVFYFQSSEFPMLEGKPRVVDIPDGILALDEASGVLKTLASFPIKAYVEITGTMGMVKIDISSLLAVPFEEKFLAISHTSEYLLKIYDPAANKVIREFGRPYQRVKTKPLTEEEKKEKLDDSPQMKYRNDILNILIKGKEIWAVTSTRDEEKGILIDAYDANGVYQDAFFVNIPKTALNSLEIPSCSTIGDGFLWLIDWIGDGNIAIRKYRLE